MDSFYNLLCTLVAIGAGAMLFTAVISKLFYSDKFPPEEPQKEGALTPSPKGFWDTELGKEILSRRRGSVYPLKLITIQAQGTKSSNKDNLIAQLKIAIEHLEAGTSSGSNNIDQCGFAFSYEDHLHQSIFNLTVSGQMIPGCPSHEHPERVSTDEIVRLILSMTPSVEGSAGGDYYEKTAAEALTAIIEALKYAGVKYDFHDLAMTMRSEAAMESLLSQLRLQNPSSQAYLNLSSFLDQYRLGKGVDSNGQKPRLDMFRLKNTLGGVVGRLSSTFNHD